MKNKTLKTVLALLVLSILSILFCQFSSFFKWDVSNKRWAWVKSRVFSPRQNIDYAIVGSSYAWCAFQPNIISKRMNEAVVWNLSRNWDGRDVDFFIVKELLEHHNVKNILLQFYDEERDRVHPFTQYLIAPIDAIGEMLFYLKHTSITEKDNIKERTNIILDYFANLSTRAYMQIFRGREDLNSQYKEASDSLNGFYILDNVAKQQKAKFADFMGKTWNISPKKEKVFLPGVRSGYYLEKIAKLCKEYNVKLYFVLVPHYLRPLPGKKNVEYLERLGDVLIPDVRVVDDMKNWRNPTHLFQLGSRRYTRQLIRLLKNGKQDSPLYKYYK